jgi:hypothetical protein
MIFSGGDARQRLRGQIEFELVDQKFLFGREFGVTRQDQGAAIGGGEMHIEHLDGCNEDLSSIVLGRASTSATFIYSALSCRKYEEETSFQVAASKSFLVRKCQLLLTCPTAPSVGDSFPPLRWPPRISQPNQPSAHVVPILLFDPRREHSSAPTYTIGSAVSVKRCTKVLPPSIAASTRSSRCSWTNTPRGSRNWRPPSSQNNLRVSLMREALCSLCKSKTSPTTADTAALADKSGTRYR